MYRRYGKRLLDLTFSVVLLIILSPLLALVLLTVRLKLGRPVLFRQKRPGLHGRVYTIFKVRTMTEERDSTGSVLSDAARLTTLGRMLRNTSLDELPELWNVLKGEMSFVGPRPLLVRYLDHYTPAQMRRHEVLPGITGWAQINGRNTITWEQKFELDVWYVDHLSLWLDLKIICITFYKILKREGINQSGQATVQEFIGNQL